MRTFVTYITVIVLFMLLSGCATSDAPPAVNDILPIQTGQTLWGIKQVLDGKPGTIIMIKDVAQSAETVFIWSCKEYWCFAGVNGTKPFKDLSDLANTGNLTNAKNMSDMVDWMRQSGWRIASNSEIPKVVMNYVGSAIAAMATRVAGNWTTFLIVPAGSLIPENVPDVLKVSNE